MPFVSAGAFSTIFARTGRAIIPYCRMLHLLGPDSDNADFTKLSRLLDHDVRVRDGDEHTFYAQLNHVARLRHAVVAYYHKAPVGCGAFIEHPIEVVEIKRGFVQPVFRGQGIAPAVLTELGGWARELHNTKYVLETGRNQPEAIRLYKKCGYQHVANFGKYVGVANSVCLQKSSSWPVLTGPSV